MTSITTPVIGFKGTEDNLLGGQEDLFFAMLSPGTEQKSVLYTFDHESGAALSSQAGSPDALTANLFASLTPIFQVGYCNLSCLKNSLSQSRSSSFILGILLDKRDSAADHIFQCVRFASLTLVTEKWGV